jgi:hypothetical protein
LDKKCLEHWGIIDAFGEKKTTFLNYKCEKKCHEKFRHSRAKRDRAESAESFKLSVD